MNDHNEIVVNTVIDMVKAAYGIQESVLGTFTEAADLTQSIHDYLITSIDVIGDHD